MNPRDLIGLRDDELTPPERAALRTLLTEDPDARREHEEAQVLGHTLASLPVVDGGPTAAELLARARAPAAVAPNRPLWAMAIPALAAAAAGIVWFGLPGDEQRARGAVTPDGSVYLEAIAEGGTVHALRSGQSVSADESVVFHITTTVQGNLTLTEYGPAGSTQVYAWSAPPGRAALGGARPLAWTTEDTSGGERRYVVEWCDEGGLACVQDELRLGWSPR